MFKVDDGEYFQTLPENTIFLFLRPGELWRPAGTDSIRSGKTRFEDLSRVDNITKSNILDMFQIIVRNILIFTKSYQ